MKPVFIERGPALLVENRDRVLVLADLHFGIESYLASRGVHIGSGSAERLERALDCIDETDPDLLLLLGDVKHNVPLTTRQEYRELPGIMESLRRRVPVRVIPGNHDGGLGRFLEDGELLPATGAVIDGTGYLHGHTLPAEELLGSLIVVGHHHPVVHLYDEVGCSLRASPAYLLATLDGACLCGNPDLPETPVLFMPAFFELAGGLDVRAIRESRLGPIARCIREEEAEVFLHDGTYIDTLAALAREQNPLAPR